MNLKTFLSISIISLCLLNGCNKNNTKKTTPTSDFVTLIFQNPPSQKRFYNFSGSYMGIANHATISFIGKGNLYENYDPNPNGDTLKIPCFGQQYIIFSHKYEGIETHEFLVQRGDTIEVCYDSKNFPILKSRLSDNLTTSYNVNYTVKGRTANFNIEPHTLLNNLHFIEIFLAKNNPSSPFHIMEDYIDFDSLYKANSNHYYNFKTILDSLEKQGQLAPIYINFYRQRLERILTVGKTKPEEKIARLKQPNSTENNHIIVLNDSLIFNYAYQGTLNHYVQNATKKEGVAQFSMPQSRFPDFRTVFDNIANDTTIPPKSKSVLLSICLDGICDNFSINDKQQYFEKFKSMTNDTVKASLLKRKWHLDFSKSQALLLMDVNGATLTFDQTIKKYNGKVIYVDFWAPWCSPCRQEMAYAEKLHERYKGKDLIFLNIVIWDTYNNWTMIKSKFEKNPQIQYFFASNSHTSRQLESLKVDLIPRFMIFDRNGNLVNQDAHRPKHPDVFEEIERWF